MGRAVRFGFVSLAVAYLVAGNEHIGGLAITWLQREYLDIDPFQSGDFDVVVVLGGTTSTAPSG